MQGDDTTLEGGAPPAPPSSARRRILVQAALLLAILAAYFNALPGEFIFADRPAILDNPTIQSLWPPWRALSPPAATAVAGRPLVNLTLALNHAVAGVNPPLYHATNIAIHALAALALFQVVALTLRCLGGRLAESAPGVALASAALWALHPLQTEAVSYVVQRGESLTGLCYLATLLAFIRSLDSPRPPVWIALAAVACAAGMASGPLMATAPLLVLLYDRAFVANSFLEIIDRRLKTHAPLAATWLIGFPLWFGAGAAQGPSPFAWLGPLDYFMNQMLVVPTYIRLVLWPRPLVVDYSWNAAQSWAEVWPGAALLVALLAATLAAIVLRPRLGFLCAAFFLLLIPSSSFFPSTDVAAERRMYLPLASLSILAALGAWAFLRATLASRAPAAGWALALAACAAFGAGTHLRNRDYKDEPTMFADVLAKRPGNAQAKNNLGVAMQRAGRLAEAERLFKEAVDLYPDYIDAVYNWGAVMALQGKKYDAVGPLNIVLLKKPDHPQARNNMGVLMAERNILDEALDHFEKAVTALPTYDEAWLNKGKTLARLGRNKEALESFERALALRPDSADAENGMAVALAGMGRPQEALAHAEKAIALDPNMIDAVNNAAATLAMLGRLDEAIDRLRRAAELAPHNSAARMNFGIGLAQKGDLAGAERELAEAVRLDPRRLDARNRYGTILAMRGDMPGAIAQFKAALEVDPYHEESKANLKKAQGMGASSAPSPGSILDQAPNSP